MTTLHPETIKYRKQIKGELRSGATTEQHGPAILTHVFSTLPVLSTQVLAVTMCTGCLYLLFLGL